MVRAARDWHVAAPQSWAEVEPHETALRQLDDRLRIAWEPQAVMVGRGTYDANGHLIAPKYEGRWKVIKLGDPHRTAMWREDALVTYVTTPVVIGSGTEKVHAMTADGPYMPIGEWLVEHLRSWDRANREAALRASAIMDAYNTKMDDDALKAGEAGEAEALERICGTTRGGVMKAHPVAIHLTTE